MASNDIITNTKQLPSLLVIGLTGVGKSSFINTFFNKKLARIDHFEPCTKIVTFYVESSKWGEYKLIDTPGFGEEENESIMDNDWLQELICIKDEIDYLIYVSRLNETRFRPEEKQAIKLISSAFGSKIWSKTLLALTFAANIPKDKYRSQLEHRSDDIMCEIYKYNSNAKIKIIIVDNYHPNWGDNLKPLGEVVSNICDFF